MFLQEPELLRIDAERIQRQMQEVAVDNYCAFISVADALLVIHKEVSSVDIHLEYVIGEIPKLTSSCTDFIESAEQILDKRKMNQMLLANHSTLLDLLEVPQLMDTYVFDKVKHKKVLPFFRCVRNGNYDEALDLEAFVCKLSTMHLKYIFVPSLSFAAHITRHSSTSCRSLADNSVPSFIASSKTHIEHSGCLDRRDWRKGGDEGMIEFEEVEIGSVDWAGGEDVRGWVGLGEISSAAVGSTKGDCMEDVNSCVVETHEKLLHVAPLLSTLVSLLLCLTYALSDQYSFSVQFLRCREAWLTGILDDLDQRNAYEYLKGIVNCHKMHLFDVVNQYRAIFADDTSGNEENYDGGLLFSWATHQITSHLKILKVIFPKLTEGGSLSNILDQCMHCAMGLGWVGLDFRGLLLPLFEEYTYNLLSTFMGSPQLIFKD
ncbi:hypothetical protein RJ640_019486 [Escallonia rubra]|uniref:Conserved oligomeric Golgi complex subunit 8 n=1 Tax=Escallonia rubra TaxID=112253 RepID=A0AA88RRU1_9ASTE|nr:hypothetical protein RJ640_019486 [Escallonia rubra]